MLSSTSPFGSAENVSNLFLMELSDPNTLPPFYVYPTTQTDNESVGIEFYLKQPHHEGPARRFSFQRNLSECLEAFLNRVVVNTSEAFCSIHRRKRKQPNGDTADAFAICSANLYKTHRQIDAKVLCSKIDRNVNLKDALLSADYSEKPDHSEPRFLRLCGSGDFTATYRLAFNPARVKECRLTTYPMTNYPVVPMIDGENLCLEKTDFLWFITKKDRWPSEPVHTGLIYTPSPSHVGHRVRLVVRPRDASGRLGIPFGNLNYWAENGEPIDCEWPIAEGPMQQYVSDRLSAVPSKLDGSQFRVVSYNILADMYASSADAQNIIFRHCPLDCLKINYRLPLLLRELTSYQADLICLQEVDKSIFTSYLVPALSVYGFAGFFVSKRKVISNPDAPACLLPTNDEKGEGPAIFYRKSRLSLIEKCPLPSILSYVESNPVVHKALEEGDHTHITPDSVPEIFARSDESNHQKSYAHCLAAGLFRFRDQVENQTVVERLLLIGNSHFYFNPTADRWRFAQALGVRHFLDEMGVKFSEKFGLPVSVLFCGDINQSPDGPVYSALIGQPDRPLGQFETAYSPSSVPFTNWVPGFCCALDVILYSRGLQCRRSLPLYSQQEIVTYLKQAGAASSLSPHRGSPLDELDSYALPNAQFPSDHLSLVADFQWLDK